MILLLACASPADDTATPVAETPWQPPDQPGLWSAGTFESTVTTAEGLVLPVQVWYPSQDTEGTLHSYDNLVTDTALDRPAPDCSAPRKVMMFSHGSGGTRFQSTFWTERLATHGWIVVAPDHIGNTFADDGDVPLLEMAFRRPLDIRTSFDWLLASDGDGELTGCLDGTTTYVMSGHSFGGYTTIALAGATVDPAATAEYCLSQDEWLCDDIADYAADHPTEATLDFSDSRITAAIPMSPAGYEVLVGGMQNLTVPILFWIGDSDDLTPLETQTRHFYDNVGGPAMLGILANAGHYTFSDACDLFPVFDDCDPPYTEPAIVHDIVDTVSIAFLQDLAGFEEAAPYLPVTDPLLTWESR